MAVTITGFVERIDLERSTLWIGKIPLRLLDTEMLGDVPVGTRVVCTFEERDGERWLTSLRSKRLPVGVAEATDPPYSPGRRGQSKKAGPTTAT